MCKDKCIYVKKKKCYFVAYTNKWLNIECITYEEEFWQKQMETKLETLVHTKRHMKMSYRYLVLYLMSFNR
ncbi:YqaJ domain-containing protein [Aphis craccivora]|uniref:YqaJ domain-containing protein n=1 Tax=Aphis craccivora TaxID=307492 RepID=A0A6G0YL67_APHCR|nr:YqaJ domain-containing protein [Aphis craccivora]